ncbi:MAG: hypothetical protein RRY65_04245 [Pseudoflavonifractor sp.]
MQETIQNIVVEEFSKLTNLIEADFVANYKKKVNNFLLSQMDERITASMVFVSSFESKSGFAIETCAKRIARLRFGDENVPAVVNPRGLPCTIAPTAEASQVIVTDVDTHNGNLRGEIAAFRANHEAQGKGRLRTESGVTQESIRAELLPLAEKYRTNTIYTKPVDLAFFDGKDWNVLELKAGGDLDSSNAPSNVEKLLTIYTDMGIENCKAYFATLYNKDGEGKVWKGSVKKHLHYPSMFLIGANFWNRILPPELDFKSFSLLYRRALEQIDLNTRIHEMISDCVGE